MANQPIPVSTAIVMMEEYLAYMGSLNVDMDNQTHSVSFVSKELLEWMQGVVEYTDEFRICLGVYPSGNAAGRITTIIWPYYEGAPAINGEEQTIEPFNEGNLNP